MRITVSIPAQTLALYDVRGTQVCLYPVSTAKNGPGERFGSYCTPRGRHIVRAKIGAGAPPNTVFVRRRPTGEVWTSALADQFPGRDWMLTRLLWLSGTQPGFNRLGEVDTMRRYIYIHGSPDTADMGTPGSIGCIRMHNDALVDLFDRVSPYTRVDIDDFQVITGTWPELCARASAIRTTVFVEEQGVPAAIEMDANDAACVHALALDGAGAPIGTGRLLPDGHIGRMAVLPGKRHLGAGRALMHALMESARQKGMHVLRLNAQVHAAGFYLPFGFRNAGPEFLEAGIIHQEMVRTES